MHGYILGLLLLGIDLGCLPHERDEGLTAHEGLQHLGDVHACSTEERQPAFVICRCVHILELLNTK
jgi:hypothetical protein